jgi:hypothetical protein
MARQNSLRPFLRCTSRSFIDHLGPALIPIASPDPEPFDAGKYGILSTYAVDGSRLSAEHALSLAKWIADDTGGAMGTSFRIYKLGSACCPMRVASNSSGSMRGRSFGADRLRLFRDFRVLSPRTIREPLLGFRPRHQWQITQREDS